MDYRLLYWPLACLLMAWAQGWLLPAIRRTPPGAEARRQSVALHVLLTVVYFLPLVLVGETSEMLRCAVVAVLSRLLLFDPTLNLASGFPAFAVGSTARSDKMLRCVANWLRWPPERLRLVVWLLSVGAACWLLIVNC